MMATGHGQWLGAGLIGRFDFRKGRNAHQRRRLPLSFFLQRKLLKNIDRSSCLSLPLLPSLQNLCNSKDLESQNFKFDQI